MALLGIYICRVSSSAGITLKCSFSCLLLNYCIDVDIVILYYTPVLSFTIIIIVIHSVHIYFSCPYSEKCNFGRWTLLLYTIETVNFFVCQLSLFVIIVHDEFALFLPLFAILTSVLSVCDISIIIIIHSVCWILLRHIFSRLTWLMVTIGTPPTSTNSGHTCVPVAFAIRSTSWQFLEEVFFEQEAVWIVFQHQEA